MSGHLEIYDLYEKLERKNIMISFKGELTSELMESILTVVERKLEGFSESATIRKKVFNVLVELLQNLFHHRGVSPLALSSGFSDGDSVIIMIARNATGYSIITGNFINNRDAGQPKQRLEEINAMGADELKQFYKQVLSNGKISQKGGAGLGMIDVARKSKDKLEYGFIPFDENHSFFSLNVKVA